MANRIAIRPRTIWASLSPVKRSTGPPGPSGSILVVSHTWLAQPGTLLMSDRAASGSGERASQFDHIAIAVVPLFEQGEVLDDFVDRHDGPRVGQPCCRCTHY